MNQWLRTFEYTILAFICSAVCFLLGLLAVSILPDIDLPWGETLFSYGLTISLLFFGFFGLCFSWGRLADD